VRLKAHLGGFAIQVGERFTIKLGHRCFYVRMPYGRGSRDWFIDLKANLIPSRPKTEADSRPAKWRRLRVAGL
jgi:hypothetical protein